MTITIPHSQINLLKEIRSRKSEDAKDLCFATREMIVANLGITGHMILKCETCNAIDLYADYDGPAIVESPACQGSCIFRSDFPSCFQKAEPDYLAYLESKGIRIEWAMTLLGIKSLFDLSRFSQDAR